MGQSCKLALQIHLDLDQLSAGTKLAAKCCCHSAEVCPQLLQKLAGYMTTAQPGPKREQLEYEQLILKLLLLSEVLSLYRKVDLNSTG